MRFYRILGASPGDTLTVIKHRYRKLILKYHPDRIRAQGFSEARASEFQRRFCEVQEAYDSIVKSRSRP